MVDLDTSTAIVGLGALKALLHSSSCVCEFVRSRGAEWLTLEAELTSTASDASDWVDRDDSVTVGPNRASRANCESSRGGVEAVWAIHLMNERATAVLATGAEGTFHSIGWSLSV